MRWRRVCSGGKGSGGVVRREMRLREEILVGPGRRNVTTGMRVLRVLLVSSSSFWLEVEHEDSHVSTGFYDCCCNALKPSSSI